MENIDDIEASLESAKGQLTPLYGNYEKNAGAIAQLMSKIKELLSKIAGQKKEGENKDGKEYFEKLGVFVSKNELAEAQRFVDCKKYLIEVQRYQTYIRSSDDAPKTSYPIPRKPIDSQGSRSEPTHTEFRGLQSKWLEKPISDKQWYNSEQVKSLTGHEVPIGTNGLKEFLASNKTVPMSFSYLKVPDPHDNSLNHFVSIHIDEKQRVTYLDSNGELMAPEDEKALRQMLPSTSISYRDHEGKKIPEEIAKQDPNKLLRVQFDGHNCGMYSTEFSRLMNSTKNESEIKAGIAAIRNIDPEQQRQKHTDHLHARVQQVDKTLRRTQGPKL